MPQIQEYRLRTEVQGPIQGRRATADELSTGKGLQHLGQGVQNLGENIQKREEQIEVSDLSVKIAEAQEKFTNHLSDTLKSADPGDRGISSRFNKSFDDYMAEVGANIKTSGGQDYFKRAASQLKSHFAISAHAGQAELAGVKAKQDYINSSNALQSSLINDPSSFEMSKQIHEAGIDAAIKAGTLPSHIGAELKTKGNTELAQAALRGWIKLNPKEGQAQIDAGKWDGYFSGDLKKQMMGEAQQGIHAKDVEVEHQRIQAKRILDEQQTKTQNDFLEKLNSNQLDSRAILDSNLDPFGAGSKDQFLKMLSSTNRSGLKTDPKTYLDLFNRIHLDDSDPNKLRNENDLNPYLGNGLDTKGLTQLRKEMQGKGTQAGNIESTLKRGLMKQAQTMLVKGNPMLGIKDPKGEENLQSFTAFFAQEYNDQRAKGKSALQLLSPDSPDYLGKHIGGFTRTPQEIIQSMTQNIKAANQVPSKVSPSTPALPAAAGISGAPPAPPKVERKPGESAQDYLKRIGKE